MKDSVAAERILGFDLLRGVFAFSVLAYHSLSWSGTVSLYNLGMYGVYGFFVLSGASMYVAYGRRMRSLAEVPAYVVQRLFRILPLLAVVGALWPFAVHLLSGSGIVPRGLILDIRSILTLSPLFGAAAPGATSSVLGAWSLGIEFVFYGFFPIMLAIYRRGWVAAAIVCTIALITQLAFIRFVFGAGASFGEAWALYTQFASFGFYFAAGMAIGKWQLERSTPASRRQSGAAIFLAVALAAGIGFSSGAAPETSLKGWQGVGLIFATTALVWTSASFRFSGAWVRAAEWLGLLSYPVYLIHPLVWHDAVAWSAKWANGSLLVTMLLLVVVTVGLSALSWLFIERPAMNYGRRISARFKLS